MKGKPRLAVWKLASCDGCQLTLLDCEDELLAVAGAVEIAHFTEASSAVVDGPYDVSLVEGSVTTERDARRILEIRAASAVLVCIGACATSGGIQALRNFADVAEFTSVVYAHPQYISALATSTPVSNHVTVDFELRGCPIDKRQLCPANRSAGAKSRFPRRAFHDSRNRCRSRTASSIRYAVAARVCRTNGRAGTRRTPWPISRSARSPRSSCKVHRFWHTSAIWRPARGVQTAKHCSACARSPATVRSARNSMPSNRSCFTRCSPISWPNLSKAAVSKPCAASMDSS